MSAPTAAARKRFSRRARLEVEKQHETVTRYSSERSSRSSRLQLQRVGRDRPRVRPRDSLSKPETYGLNAITYFKNKDVNIPHMCPWREMKSVHSRVTGGNSRINSEYWSFRYTYTHFRALKDPLEPSGWAGPLISGSSFGPLLRPIHLGSLPTPGTSNTCM